MFKEIDKLTLITVSSFILGIMCLLLNVIHRIFNLFFVFFIILGLTIVLVKKIKEYTKFKSDILSAKESIVVDLSLSNDGSYEMMDKNISKKQMVELKRLKKDKRMIIWILFALLLLMGYLAYRIIKTYYFG